MSQTRRSSAKDVEDANEESEHEVGEIASHLRRGRHQETDAIPPSILGWKVNCPHCGESFMVRYADNGTYELSVEA